MQNNRDYGNEFCRRGFDHDGIVTLWPGASGLSRPVYRACTRNPPGAGLSAGMPCVRFLRLVFVICAGLCCRSAGAPNTGDPGPPGPYE